MELRLVEVTSTPEEDDERRRQSFQQLLEQGDWIGTPSSALTEEERARTRRHEAFMNRSCTCYSFKIFPLVLANISLLYLPVYS